MSLNIKNETVHDLVRKAAARTGQSQTAVVETAVRQYLDGLSDAARAGELDAVVAGMQQRWSASKERPFEINDLYDPVTGLPA